MPTLPQSRRRQIERLLDDLGRAQHMYASLEQLHRHGVSEGEMRWLRSQGRIIPSHPGVVRLSGAPDGPGGELHAAVLAAHGAVASHRSGCWLYGIDVPIDLTAAVRAEITVPRAQSPRLRGVIVHRSTDLSPDQVTERDGIPVTDPYRLAIDLGAVCPIWVTERAIEQLIVRKLIDVPVLRARLDAISRRGRRGAGVAREILDRRALGDKRPDSILESMMSKLIDDAGLERPTFQHQILVKGRWRRIDFAYPERKIAIEVMGYEFHSGRERSQDDKVRTNDLQLMGWIVLQFTWDDVRRRPSYVAAQVRAALRR